VHLGGSLLMRWFYMLVASGALIFLFSRSMRTLMRQDPATRYRPGFLKLWHELGKRDLLPPMGSIGRAVMRYFKPSFHPSTEGDLQVALDYLASSPAAQRAAAEVI
jgi:predicted metal-dependent hydrolase